jgi:hypothetical protein
MDRALGELNEDTTVLFDTYLAEHPEAHAWAQGMSDICARTQRAIDSKTREESAVHHVAGTRRPQSRRIHWARFGRWAAVVVVSVSIGVTIGRWFRPQVPAQDSQVVQAEPAGSPENWQQVLSRQGQGFWQSKALALLQTTPYTAAESYASQTNLWGKYKQIRKERSDE